MNDDTTRDPDQTDEDILTGTLSDEVLEAAAGTERRASTGAMSNCTHVERPYCC
jgi:hypothetical protein